MNLRSLLNLSILGIAHLSTPQFLPTAGAQVSIGGDPSSFRESTLVGVPTETMPFVDVGLLEREDSLATDPGPFRFGATLEVDLSPDTHGTWDVLANGNLLWRLRIESPGSIHTSVLFDRYWVPPGATLHVYGDDRSFVLGAFTEANLNPSGKFTIQPVPGEALTLEYQQPVDAQQHADLHIHRVVHAYRDIMGLKSGGLGSSGACNVNVACPAGNPWGNQINSVARICITNYTCSGALINNTNQDGRQLFLTADHCDDGSPGSWLFQFNYEGANCASTAAPNHPNWHAVCGAAHRASDPLSDFYLAEILIPIPATFNAIYAGWDRSGAAFPNSFGIHHPGGDIKKICVDDDASAKATHLGMEMWHVADWDLGVTETGSSGSPLFNDQGRIVGQLYGGAANCDSPVNDYYGRLDVSWPLGADDWLDPPPKTGALVLGDHNPGTPPELNPEVYCTAKQTSVPGLPRIGWTGQPKLSTNNLAVTVANAVPNKPGIAFWGLGAASIPFLGGTLCASPPLIRSSPFQLNGVGAHSHSFPLGPSDIGKMYFFQFWFRDPAHPDGTGVGLSDALRVRVELL